MSRDSWRILVVDDDRDMHEVTHLALKRRSWRERSFEIVDAFSEEEGRKILKASRSSFQVAIIDVVMETDHAGLDLCRFIRSAFSSSLRIILRTGQAGKAPEDVVLEAYDIDHYLSKSEATAPRLFGAVRACLRSSMDIDEVERANASLIVTNADLQRQIAIRERYMKAVKEAEAGPLARLMEVVQTQNSGEPTASSRYVAEQVAATAEMLSGTSEPRDFRLSTEAALQNKSLIILLQEQKALRLTRRALAGTNASAIATEHWQEAHDGICNGKVDILFVDWENLALLSEASRRNPEVQGVLMTNQSNFEDHGEEIMNLPIAGAVVIGGVLAESKEPDPLLVQELVVTAGKLLSSDIFGLEKYLAWGVRIVEEKITASQERSKVLEHVRDYANSCSIRPALQRKVLRLADELLMNGLWDAPADVEGRPKYKHLSRNEPLLVGPEEAVTLRWASDGNLLAMSCSDNFGRLTKNTAVQYLKKCFARDADPLENVSGGAGLGLYMAFLAISTLVINVDPGRKTEVIGLINLRSGERASSPRARSFHYFRT